MKRILLLGAVLISGGAAFSQLTGTYTVYGTSPDYATIQDACTDLQTNGQSGPVVFSIRDGVHNEAITLGAVAGNSAANSITFQSESNDSTAVTVTSATTNTFTFTDVNHVGFNNLGISFTGASGYAVQFINGGNAANFNMVAVYYNTFNGPSAIDVSNTGDVNNFYFGNSTLVSNHAGINVNSSNGNTNFCSIDGATINSAGDGLYLYGYLYANNLNVDNSEINAGYGSAVYAQGYYAGMDNISISNSMLTSVDNYALYAYTDYHANNGNINGSEFVSDNYSAVYISATYTGLVDWMISNSDFDSYDDVFYMYSEQPIKNITFENDTVLGNIGGVCCTSPEGIYLESDSWIDGIDIHDCFIKLDSVQFGADVVYLDSDGILSNIHIYDNETHGYYGIYFYSTSSGNNWIIENNDIYANDDAIYLYPEYSNGSDIHISDNNIYSAGGGIYIYAGAVLQETWISVNTIESIDEAIYLEGEYGNINNIYIDNNDIYADDNKGIYMYTDGTMSDVEITNNDIESYDETVYAEGYYGGLDGFTTYGNKIKSNDNYGYYLYSYGTIKNTWLYEDSVTTYYTGVYIEGEYGGMTEVEVHDMFVDSEFEDGIYVTTSYGTLQNTMVYNNEVYADTTNYWYTGIYFESDDSDMDNVKIFDNDVYGGYYGIYVEADYGNATNSSITGNNVKGSEYGIYFDGAGSNSIVSKNNIYPNPNSGTSIYGGIYAYGLGGPNENVVISENYIENPGSYGIEAYYLESVKIQKNNMYTDESGYNSFGIYGSYLTGSNSKIERNQILADAESEGIYIQYGSFPSTSPLLVANNFISGMEYSIDLYGTVNVDIIHNSVASAINTQMVYLAEATNTQIMNNIFKNTNTSGEIYYGDALTSGVTVDYNAYDFDDASSNMSNDAYFGNNSTFADFQTNFGQDANAIEQSVAFTHDTTDLHIPCTATALTVGIPSVVMTDIDGLSRNATTPTIGAHEISPAVANFLPDSMFLCNSVELTSSATGASYNWSTGATTQSITVSSTGTYYMTLTDACGNTSDDSTVVWTDTPVADFAWGMNGFQGVFNNMSSGATSYSWDFGDGNTSTEENPVHDYTAGGTYTVLLTVYNDCGGSDTMSVEVLASLAGVEESSLEDRGFNVYPNPTESDVTIDFAMLLGEDITLYLVDMDGRVVYTDMISNQVGAYQKQLSLNEFSNGMYLLQVATETETITKRIVKK